MGKPSQKERERERERERNKQTNQKNPKPIRKHVYNHDFAFIQDYVYVQFMLKFNKIIKERKNLNINLFTKRNKIVVKKLYHINHIVVSGLSLDAHYKKT